MDLTYLQQAKGQGTQLVSLYVPPHYQTHQVLEYLRNEQSQAQNIKSKQTRKAVVDALASIQHRVKVESLQPTGIAVFYDGDTHVVRPLEAVPFLYRCGSTFFLEPLERQIPQKKVTGLVVVDQKEASVGLLVGSSVRTLWTDESQVPNKHSRGGQSAQRFERLHDEAVHNWFGKVGGAASRLLMDCELVVVGGPGLSKDEWLKGEYLHHELRKRLSKQTFDVGYTNDQGLKELSQNAREVISDENSREQKELMDEFLTCLAKDKPCDYGPNVSTHLETGRIKKLLSTKPMDGATIIDPESESGKMLQSFGGLAAILRY